MAVSNKQTLHKVSAIVLLLTLFGIPFYLERSQIGSFNNGAYLAAGVIGSRMSSPPAAANTVLSGPTNTWAITAGSDFIGADAH